MTEPETSREELIADKLSTQWAISVIALSGLDILSGVAVAGFTLQALMAGRDHPEWAQAILSLLQRGMPEGPWADLERGSALLVQANPVVVED